MRVFIGIPPTEEIRDKASKIIEKFKMKGVKTVKPENLHWTVKFLGEIGEKELEEVKKKMDKIKGENLEIEVTGIGTFPSSSRIRVIWIGVGEGNKEFTEFIRNINKMFGSDEKLKPHLTIGRVKFVSDREKLIKTVEKLKDVNLGKMKVKKIVLYRSELTPQGPIYTEIKKVEW